MRAMGASELLIILVIVVLLFGASKLPELGRSLGAGLTNFKQGLKEGDESPTGAAPPANAASPSLLSSSSGIEVNPAPQRETTGARTHDGDA